jgi:transposase
MAGTSNAKVEKHTPPVLTDEDCKIRLNVAMTQATYKEIMYLLEQSERRRIRNAVKSHELYYRKTNRTPPKVDERKLQIRFPVMTITSTSTST